MSAQPLPVAIHRWFADREDWAYHTSLRDYVPALIDAVDRELKARGEGVFVKPWDYGWLIGERLLDRQCLNMDAAKRLPTVFRVTSVRQEPTEREKGMVLAALRGLVLPTSKGASEALVLSFEPPPTLPMWPRAKSGSGSWFGQMFSSSGPAAGPAPLTGPELARQLEVYWRFYLENGTPQDLYPVLAEKWRGVTAQGRVVRRSDFTGQGGIRPTDFPALVPGRDLVEVILDEGILVVTGEPHLHGHPVRCVHVYALRPEGGTWEMIAATVTPLSAAVAAIPIAAVAPSLGWMTALPAPPAAQLPPGGTAPHRGSVPPYPPSKDGDRTRD